MRRFWQSIAFTMLVLIAPASAHCLGVNSMTNHASAETAETTSIATCAHTDELPKSSEDGGKAHDCPTDSLTKSNVPAGTIVPAVICSQADDILKLLRQMADAVLASAKCAAVLPTIDSEDPQNTWVFSSRAALPARSPSDLA